MPYSNMPYSNNDDFQHPGLRRANSTWSSTSGSAPPSSPSNASDASNPAPGPRYCSEDPTRRWCCLYCEYRSARKYNCERHMMEICGHHFGYRAVPIECPVHGCGKRHRRVDRLKKHIRESHRCDEGSRDILLKVVDSLLAEDEDEQQTMLQELTMMLQKMNWGLTEDGFIFNNNAPFDSSPH